MQAGAASNCSTAADGDALCDRVIDGATEPIAGGGGSGSLESPQAPAINNTETTAACITRSFK
jgi:hypothetical protein